MGPDHDEKLSVALRALRVAVTGRDELGRRRVADVLERDGFEVSDELDITDRGRSVPDVLVVVAPAPNDPEDPAGLGRLPLDVPTVVVAITAGGSAVDDALAAGAAGVVPDHALDERLGPTIRAVAVGQVVIPVERRSALGQRALSARERQVMSMVVLGFTNLEVANKLHVTETTVKSHLSSAYRKLGVRSRHEATALILSNKQLGVGILTLTGEPRQSES